MTSSSDKKPITQSMLDKLAYDQNIETTTKITSTMTSNPFAMVIFHQSDIEAATYKLAKSIDDPQTSGGVKLVFVQESCAERFTANLKSKLKTYSEDQLQGLNLKDTIKQSNKIVSKLTTKTISPEGPLSYASILVWDFSQEYFKGDSGAGDGKALPIVCLFSFRTSKEAIALIKKETTNENVSIWCENQAMAYEVITATSLQNYYLNCFDVSLSPLHPYIQKAQPYALVENSYHYETLQISGHLKSIVFPFGTIFAN
ncbi:uncharacterized protein LOC129945830 [Eupeodes corollae]|uniref:uncharacterized protein LOC129945830 n=1 Tax=Eupeodes corollae TaxID=290404 RepID=UPI0024934FA1|nr:uncharacterized protein LOC129945830 [Eupeodes corollae]